MFNFRLIVRVIIYTVWFNITIAQLNNNNVCVSEECVETAALISTSIDHKVDPCHNFYQYACGNWQKDHPSAPTNRQYSWSHWHKLNNDMIENLKDLMVNRSLDNSPKYLDPLINFYGGCTNIKHRDLNTTIERDFDNIRSIMNLFGGWPNIDDSWNETNFDLEDALIELYTFIKAKKLFIDIEVIEDLRNNTNFIVGIGNPYDDDDIIEGIYRLPRPPKDENIFADTEYYADKSPVQIVTEALRGSEINQTEWDAEYENMKLLDQQLRNISTQVNASVVYNNWESFLTQFKTLKSFDGINVSKIVAGLMNKEGIKINDNDIIYIDDTNYLTNLGEVLQNHTKRTIANFISTSMAMILVKFTSTSMDHVVTNIASLASIPNQCMYWAEEVLADIVSRLYLDNLFEKQSISDMKSLIEEMRHAFNQTLNENDWMDEMTKALALKKLNAIREYIAFPEYISNDTALENQFSIYNTIGGDNFLAFMVKYFNHKRSVDTLKLKGQTLAKGHWPSGAYGVMINAFYYPELNGIFFPAGIAQLPFFHHNRTMITNFGAIGTIIGHEMTHGFDNTGTLFDAIGNLDNWITNSSKQNFIERSSCFVEQYSRFQYNVGAEQPLNISGIKTLGENIADNGGVRIAYRAMQNYKAENVDQLRLPGTLSTFTEEQIFFLSYANMWCSIKNGYAVSDQINTDPHSIENARVIAPLANFDQFARAFNCAANSTMNPITKCTLW